MVNFSSMTGEVSPPRTRGMTTVICDLDNEAVVALGNLTFSEALKQSAQLCPINVSKINSGQEVCFQGGEECLVDGQRLAYNECRAQARELDSLVSHVDTGLVDISQSDTKWLDFFRINQTFGKNNLAW